MGKQRIGGLAVKLAAAALLAPALMIGWTSTAWAHQSADTTAPDYDQNAATDHKTKSSCTGKSGHTWREADPNATPAVTAACIHKNDQTDAESGLANEKAIKDTINKFMDGKLGDVLSELSVVIGIVIIISVTGLQLVKAVKSGVGILTVLPTILVAFLVGGLLINIKAAVGLFAWLLSIAQAFVEAVTGVVADAD